MNVCFHAPLYSRMCYIFRSFWFFFSSPELIFVSLVYLLYLCFFFSSRAWIFSTWHSNRYRLFHRGMRIIEYPAFGINECYRSGRIWIRTGAHDANIGATADGIATSAYAISLLSPVQWKRIKPIRVSTYPCLNGKTFSEFSCAR